MSGTRCCGCDPRRLRSSKPARKGDEGGSACFFRRGLVAQRGRPFLRLLILTGGNSSGGDLARAQAETAPACAQCRGTRNVGQWADRRGCRKSSTLRLNLKSCSCGSGICDGSVSGWGLEKSKEERIGLTGCGVGTKLLSAGGEDRTSALSRAWSFSKMIGSVGGTLDACIELRVGETQNGVQRLREDKVSYHHASE